jgi:hypothetical protein
MHQCVRDTRRRGRRASALTPRASLARHSSLRRTPGAAAASGVESGAGAAGASLTRPVYSPTAAAGDAQSEELDDGSDLFTAIVGASSRETLAGAGGGKSGKSSAGTCHRGQRRA